ncbi:pentapeptide repeat-containing protein [Paenibacillus alginolyticus]|uniref:pentapeptide repeat-containing protein n=1 Tax=Paenibacillus alginolyticus TaxID=59839 RepID=UPI0009FDE855
MPPLIFTVADFECYILKLSPSVHLVKLTGAKISKSNLRGASFKNCTLDLVEFRSCDLTGVCMDNLHFTGTTFHHSNLNGAKIDKVTYAL